MPTVAAIRTEGLEKRFGATVALAGIDLEVRPGEVLGFLGPNGAGKTTTIRLLLDLLRPTAGRAEVLGLDVRRSGPEVRRRIGYLPGEVAFPTRLTGREWLVDLARIRGVDATHGGELAERFGVDLDRPARHLSRGNRQKLALVQAFLHRPEVVVLDEPTSGLDPLVQQQFQAVVREFVDGGGTVFLSSHVLSEVQRVADRVAILRAGSLVVVEDVDDLRAKAIRRLELRFAAPVPGAEFADLPGVRSCSVVSDRVLLEIAGDVDAVVKAAARHHLVDLERREADLDEVFLAFYRGDGEGPA
jgi:ABC-2 type transport system ATP-binding protein